MKASSLPTIIKTTKAPAAIGPYSQAVMHNGNIYTSGQIGIDPETGEICAGDFLSQAQQVLKNLDQIAQAANCSLASAIKFTVYLTDLDNFQVLNDLMVELLEDPYPARVCVEVSALPKGALLEIDAIFAA